MRRYRIQWPVKGGGLPHMECSADDFERENDDMDEQEWNAVRALRLGQSAQLGGGAAPTITIICIGE